MTDDAYGATVAKRRLSRRLAELRLRSGHTANHVCDMLNWGRGKVGRFEANQWKRPEMSDIRDLLRIYGVDERHARKSSRSWPSGPAPGPGGVTTPTSSRTSSPASRTTPSGSGSSCRWSCPACCRPRTTRRRSCGPGRRPPAWRRGRWRPGCAGRRSWTGPTAPRPTWCAVITEASLMYQWGTRAERREQIEHLIEMSRRPNVELRIQRFADGPEPGRVVLDQHLRTSRRRAEPSSSPKPTRHPGGEQARRGEHVHPSLRPDPRCGPGARSYCGLPEAPS